MKKRRKEKERKEKENWMSWIFDFISILDYCREEEKERKKGKIMIKICFWEDKLEWKCCMLKLKHVYECFEWFR